MSTSVIRPPLLDEEATIILSNGCGEICREIVKGTSTLAPSSFCLLTESFVPLLTEDDQAIILE